ncbi:GATOR complex protein WDR24 [Scaptodrosophila lebanonensis]|uniref:GATOR complex protein WDR24 n=1 Tax=Drosophila lebanonensis TaxID=7225 RepID=A0A6J2UDR9_DROLE|nr:GATOR complex protein WDR24 [Scaptodrosophila lebanonensis]XP_030385568.1 GATOR complex protein WDR24 [Scaptodrosophila lebanonensis]
MLMLLPLLSIFGDVLIAGLVEANLSLGFKAIKLPRHSNPANCSVGNTTFAHGATFKLDCKTQCVCENGRHACSTLCPNEQLPAPEDTISCRSPRLVEVPGHCCKMWLCENPTADVYATCHNSTASNWTACSRSCGLGIATRHINAHAGCQQLSNLRLCENRKCEVDNNNYEQPLDSTSHLMAHTGQWRRLKQKGKHQHPAAANLVASQQQHHKHLPIQQGPQHRIRKGHECRSIQRLGPARVRLGECVSRKLYRPKLCGRCHRSIKCCVPAVSTTIQVEMLCPLNAVDPINYVQQQVHKQQQAGAREEGEDEDDDVDDGLEVKEPEEMDEVQQGVGRVGQWAPQLWDSVALEPINQEFLQSHQIQIENKFIAVEWILKCECSKNNCNNDNDGNNSSSSSSNYNYGHVPKYSNNNNNNNNYGHHNYKNNNNNRRVHAANKSKQTHYQHTQRQTNRVNNGVPDNEEENEEEINSDIYGNNSNSNNNNNNNKNNNNNDNDDDQKENDSSSAEQQPDIIPYPLSVGETSWKTAKLRRQQQQEQQHKPHWQRT